MCSKMVKCDVEEKETTTTTTTTILVTFSKNHSAISKEKYEEKYIDLSTSKNSGDFLSAAGVRNLAKSWPCVRKLLLYENWPKISQVISFCKIAVCICSVRTC